jgi:hypothetical protein
MKAVQPIVRAAAFKETLGRPEFMHDPYAGDRYQAGCGQLAGAVRF